MENIRIFAGEFRKQKIDFKQKFVHILNGDKRLVFCNTPSGRFYKLSKEELLEQHELDDKMEHKNLSQDTIHVLVPSLEGTHNSNNVDFIDKIIQKIWNNLNFN